MLVEFCLLRVYHWKSRDLDYQSRIPWSTFFDLESLRRFVPVMEFEEFLKSKWSVLVRFLKISGLYSSDFWDPFPEKF